MSPSTERANSEEMETNYPNFDDPEIVDTHEGNDDDYYYGKGGRKLVESHI